MRLRCCLGMIWSVSTFSRYSGATTPRCLRIGSMALVPVLPAANIDEPPGNSGGSSGCGTHEVSASFPALAAFEVAVAGGSAALLGREDVGIHSQTHRASRLAPLRPRVLEDAVEAFLLRGLLYGFRSWNDKDGYIRMHLVSVNDFRRGPQIFQPPVGARPDEHPIERDVRDVCSRLQSHVLKRRDHSCALGRIARVVRVRNTGRHGHRHSRICAPGYDRLQL